MSHCSEGSFCFMYSASCRQQAIRCNGSPVVSTHKGTMMRRLLYSYSCSREHSVELTFELPVVWNTIVVISTNEISIDRSGRCGCRNALWLVWRVHPWDWTSCSHMPFCIVTTSPSRNGLTPLNTSPGHWQKYQCDKSIFLYTCTTAVVTKMKTSIALLLQ